MFCSANITRASSSLLLKFVSENYSTSFYNVSLIEFNRVGLKVCWEKFARYFEVELKEVKLRDGYYVMDPEKAAEMVDENTICVAAILGSTLNGEFEDVKRLNDLLVEKNAETGYFSHSRFVYLFLQDTDSLLL
jgi:hypothetical protein